MVQVYRYHLTKYNMNVKYDHKRCNDRRTPGYRMKGGAEGREAPAG